MKKLSLRIIQLCAIIKYIIVYFYCKVFKVNNDNVWLISERGNDARDNGLALYNYIKNNVKQDIVVKFVISKKSKDIDNLKFKEDIVELGSFKHYKLFITASYLISSHIMGYSPEFRIFNKLDKYKLLKLKGKRIFLQHGITKDDTGILNSKNINVDLFVCGAKPEYDFLIDTSGFDSRVLKYTGFSRFDNLKSINSNIILIMPTWRKSLFYCSNIDEFKKTDYFKNWNELLNNKDIKKWLKENDKKIVFYPHYEVQPYINSFNIQDDNIIIASKENYDVQELLNKCKVLITDYSSVFFDVCYLRKPVIFFHFDYEQYRQEHYKKGWFDYYNKSVGPVFNDVEKIFDYIKKLDKNDYLIDEKYDLQIKKIFELNDYNNSKRIFDEIQKIGE